MRWESLRGTIDTIPYSKKNEISLGTMVNTIIFTEQATDASVLATENWGLNMEIVDFINYSEEGFVLFPLSITRDQYFVPMADGLVDMLWMGIMMYTVTAKSTTFSLW